MWTVFGWISVGIVAVGGLSAICKDDQKWYVRLLTLVLMGIMESYLIKTLLF